MIQLDRHSRAARSSTLGPAAVSAGIHAVAIAAWLIVTLHRPIAEPQTIPNTLIYIPSLDRMRAQAGSEPAARHVAAKSWNRSRDLLTRPRTRPTRDTSGAVGDHAVRGRDSAMTAAIAASAGNDSVYSVLDVDSAVTRSPSSAAPTYPPVLAAARIQGYVTARFVVDTSGLPDTATFSVLESTNPAFAVAVHDALPRMRFTAAKIGARKIRQLVQQDFVFRVDEEGSVSPSDAHDQPARSPAPPPELSQPPPKKPARKRVTAPA